MKDEKEFDFDNDDFDFEIKDDVNDDSPVGEKVIRKDDLSYRIARLTKDEFMSYDHPECYFHENVIAVLDELESGGVVKFPENAYGYNFSNEIMSANIKDKTKYLLLVAHKVSVSELLNDSAKLSVLKMIILV
ncbi:TPA: hypothetical protein VEN67_006749, partial [Pseudomonas aeruginosa]|nr:hypothetical protein [Pseudomonas aeruginosa]